MQVVGFLLAFSVGIAVGGSNGASYLLVGMLGALVASAFFIAKHIRVGVLVVLGTVLFFIGAVRMELGLARFKHVSFPESPVEAVVTSIDERETGTLVYGKIPESNTKILIRSFEKVGVLPGDRIVSTGAVELPEPFITDTGRIFNYPLYLESRGVSFIQNAREISILAEGKPSVRRFFTALNQKTGDLLGRSVSFPIDSITSGMVLGDRSTIPESVTSIFQNTGTLHLLVLSGYNVTLLITFLGLLLRRAPFYVRTVLLCLAVVSLVLLSGAGISAIRAGLMALIVLLGQVTGRQYEALRALGITFVALLLWNPFLLLYDPGFQLSFLATLCMIVVVPKAEPLFARLPKMFWRLPIREAVTLAVTVSVFMLPFIAYFSGSISLLTIPANFVASFFVPVITLLGIAVIFITAITPFLGMIIGTILSLVGKILVALLSIAATVPNVTVPPFSWVYVALVYLAIFSVLFLKRTPVEKVVATN